MEYVMSSHWSLMERFDITDASGTPLFEARGHLGARISLLDPRGQEVADIRKHVMTDTHEVYLGGQRVAQVRHAGIFGDKYDIESGFGRLEARGHFDGGDYTVSRGGAPVARMVRKFSLREKFAVDVADEENQAFLLAIVLAIEAIHDERRQQDRGAGLGMGMGMGGGGGFGGGIAGMIERDIL
ncbi:MAG TPA: hypothetical protein VMB74_14550 [Streptosporangiaceae bacterium]|nr:hypothetical protein [Streptosporangiaceae bacterium]